MSDTYRLSVSARLTGVRPVPGVVVGRGYGTAAGDFDDEYSATLTVDVGMTAVLNFNNGSLLNRSGAAVRWANLRSLVAWVSSGGDSSGVKVKPGAANGNTLWFGGASHYSVMYPSGEPFSQGSPAGVTVDSTHCTVELVNLGAAAAGVTVVATGLRPDGVTFFPGTVPLLVG